MLSNASLGMVSPLKPIRGFPTRSIFHGNSACFVKPLHSGNRVAQPSCRRVIQPQAMFSGFAKLFKGDPSVKTKERLQPIVDSVNALDTKMKAMSDDDLKAMTLKLKQRRLSGESLDSLLPEAFAVRFNFSRRVAVVCKPLCFVNQNPMRSDYLRFWYLVIRRSYAGTYEARTLSRNAKSSQCRFEFRCACSSCDALFFWVASYVLVRTVCT